MIKEYRGIKVNINQEDLNKTNVIYKMTFPNGKVYIGQTNQLLKTRLSRHCSEANNIKSKTYNTIKSNAIRKYMEFKLEILHQADINCLDTLEQIYIAKYKSTNREFGYNLDSGGNSNKKLSEETKRKIGKANSGVKISEETRQKLRDSHLNKGCKPVIVTEIATGIEIKFKSVSSAAEYLNLAQNTISTALTSSRKVKRKYMIKYE